MWSWSATWIAFRYHPAAGKRIFASLAPADFLQFAYAWAEQQAQG
jgi:hypothetical protein